MDRARSARLAARSCRPFMISSSSLRVRSSSSRSRLSPSSRMRARKSLTSSEPSSPVRLAMFPYFGSLGLLRLDQNPGSLQERHEPCSLSTGKHALYGAFPRHRACIPAMRVMFAAGNDSRVQSTKEQRRKCIDACNCRMYGHDLVKSRSSTMLTSAPCFAERRVGPQGFPILRLGFSGDLLQLTVKRQSVSVQSQVNL